MDILNGNDYRFRLNKNAPNYQEILSDIAKEINENRKSHQSLGKAGWDGFISIDNGVIRVIMGADYPTENIKLSSDTVKKIKENIKTNPDYCYYYRIDIGNNKGTLHDFDGLAKALAQKIEDTHLKLHKKEGQETFAYYIQHNDEIKQLERFGEAKRLQRKIFNNSYEIVFNPSTNNDKKKDELIAAYFLVNGTKELIRTETDLGIAPLSLKEILYAADHGKKHNSNGKKLLERLTMLGVKFDEETKDISGNLLVGGKLGDPIRPEDPELINRWYKRNKARFIHYPKFSEEVLEMLKTEFPATYDKLNVIINRELPPKPKSKYAR